MPFKLLISLSVAFLFSTHAHSQNSLGQCSPTDKDTILGYANHCFVRQNNFGIQTFRSYEFDGQKILIKNGPGSKPNDGPFAEGYTRFFAKPLYCYIRKHGREETIRRLPDHLSTIVKYVGIHGVGECLENDGNANSEAIDLIASTNGRESPCLYFLYKQAGESKPYPKAKNCPDNKQLEIKKKILQVKNSKTSRATISRIQIEGAEEFRNHASGGPNPNDGSFVTAYFKCYAPAVAKIAGQSGNDAVRRLLPGHVNINYLLKQTVPRENVINTDAITSFGSERTRASCHNYLLKDVFNQIVAEQGHNDPYPRPMTNDVEDPLGYNKSSLQYSSSNGNSEAILALFQQAKTRCSNSGEVRQNVNWCMNLGESGENTPIMREMQDWGIREINRGYAEKKIGPFMAGYAACQVHQARCVLQPHAIQLTFTALGYPGAGAALNKFLENVSCTGRTGRPAEHLVDQNCLPYMTGMALVKKDHW